MQFEILSDIGKKRTVNEDSAAVYTLPEGIITCSHCGWDGRPPWWRFCKFNCNQSNWGRIHEVDSPAI